MKKEQGGLIDYNGSIGATDTVTVSFSYLVPFTSLSYTLIFTSNRTNCYSYEADNSTTGYYHNTRTLTGAKVGFRNVNISESSSGNKRASYYVCGY